LLDISDLFKDIFSGKGVGKLSSGTPYIDPVSRKARWEQSQTDPTNVVLNNFRLEFNFDIPAIRWSFNFNLNFLIDLNQAFQFQLPSSDMVSLVEYSIGRYGEARYGYSKYDPPDVSNDDIKKLFWWFRYYYTDKKHFDPKSYLKTGEYIYTVVKDVLEDTDISDVISKCLLPTSLIYEGKVLTGAYVGACVVGIAKVMPEPQGSKFVYTHYYMRSPEDCQTILKNGTVTVHEPTVGYSLVGYSTVAPHTKYVSNLKYRSSVRLIPKKVGDIFSEQVEKGRTQFLPNEIPTPDGVIKYQPYSISQMNYETCLKKKYRGGRHQYLQQDVINTVKRILNREGVINAFRKAYIDFALEYMYYKYPSKKRKSWKVVIKSPETIIQKYVKMGCDENILRKIANNIYQLIE